MISIAELPIRFGFAGKFELQASLILQIVLRDLGFRNIPFLRSLLALMLIFHRPTAQLIFSVVVLIALSTFAFAQKANSRNTRSSGAANEMTIKVEVKNRTYVGKPLVWDGKNMQLLRRDGRMTFLPVASHDDYEVLANSFSRMSKSKVVAKLKKEFGSRYTVSTTSSFIVVHPHGSYQKWAKPFEDLNLRFASYFSTRGNPLNAPEFPMVAVVLNTRGEFDRMLKGHYEASPNMLGYYSPRSNRIITYDQTKDAGKSIFDTNTLVHEATHQTAFNRGVHNRFGDYSSWMVEGLACMFEADGVNNGYIHTKRKDRVNSARLYAIQRMIEDGSAKGTLEKIVRDDNLFRSDDQLAYAYAWGLTFYLAENKQRDYLRFLIDDAKREDFSAYGPSERIERFAKVFGDDFNKTEARMFNFLMKQNVQIPKGYTRR